VTGPQPFAAGDTIALTEFLRAADLTVSGIGEPNVQLWLEHDADGGIMGSAGIELDGADVLLRSIAVHPSRRGSGRGTQLAQFALTRAAQLGATRAWLFSRRSGPFWQGLGFQPADVTELSAALASTHQVCSFAESGQLGYEVAWSRSLPRSIRQGYGAGRVE
jgi:N-acetylglutamate synthase-like GNAT family acetyltransferase